LQFTYIAFSTLKNATYFQGIIPPPTFFLIFELVWEWWIFYSLKTGMGLEFSLYDTLRLAGSDICPFFEILYCMWPPILWREINPLYNSPPLIGVKFPIIVAMHHTLCYLINVHERWSFLSQMSPFTLLLNTCTLKK